MLTLVLAIKLVAEIALLALFGQWCPSRIPGASRQCNPNCGVLRMLGRPWVGAVRWMAPHRVADRYVPLLAFGLLLLVWAVASMVKVGICLQIGVTLCK